MKGSFSVSESFLGDLAALHRQTGDVAPRPRGSGRKSLATPVVLGYFFALSAATVGRMLLRLRLTRKKNAQRR